MENQHGLVGFMLSNSCRGHLSAFISGLRLRRTSRPEVLLAQDEERRGSDGKIRVVTRYAPIPYGRTVPLPTFFYIFLPNLGIGLPHLVTPLLERQVGLQFSHARKAAEVSASRSVCTS